jgi:hypothetical protein
MYFRFIQGAKRFAPSTQDRATHVYKNGMYIAVNCLGRTRTANPSAGEPRLPRPLVDNTPKGGVFHVEDVTPKPAPNTPTVGPVFAAALEAAKVSKAQERTAKREEKAAKSAAYWERVAANKAARDAAKAKRAVERTETIARREAEKAAEAKRLAAAIASAPKPLTANNRKFQEAALADIRATNAKRYGL